MTRAADDPALVLLRDADGETWKEIRKGLPDGGRSIVVQIESPGLRASSWAVVLLWTKLVLTRVGTKGAAWALFSPADRVQFWLPGDLDVEAGWPLEVEVSEP